MKIHKRQILKATATLTRVRDVDGSVIEYRYTQDSDNLPYTVRRISEQPRRP